MSEPLSVSLAQLNAAAADLDEIATALTTAVRAAERAIDRAYVPTDGWLASAATRQVVTLAASRLTAIARDLSAASDALLETASAYDAVDDRAARRYPSGRRGPEVPPW